MSLQGSKFFCHFSRSQERKFWANFGNPSTPTRDAQRHETVISVKMSAAVLETEIDLDNGGLMTRVESWRADRAADIEQGLGMERSN